MSDLVMDAHIASLQDEIRTATTPLTITGGQTRGAGVKGGQTLSTKALRGIRHYDPGALVMTAYAGTPIAEIEAAMTEKGQYFAFEPRDHRRLSQQDGVPTLGGAIASNAYGERRFRFGAARDAVLGVRFLNAEGAHIRAGGEVIKNVTGYDLSRLHVGAFGAFGVLTEVSLRLWPKPVETRSFVKNGNIRDLWPLALKIARAPLEATAIVYANDKLSIRMEGDREELARRVAQLQNVAAFDEVDMDWVKIRDLHDFEMQGEVYTVFTTPNKAANLYQALENLGKAMISQAGNEVIFAAHDGVDFEGECSPILTAHGVFARPVLAQAGRFPKSSAVHQRYWSALKSTYDPKHIFTPIEALL